jgi:putative two-component system response regulator
VSERVLVVDDEAQVSRTFTLVLERAGYAVSVAANVREARTVLASEAFALLLADIEMPGESGLALLRDPLMERSRTAAIVISGLDDMAIAASALELGAYGYLIKPVGRSELTIAVTNALRRRRLELAAWNRRRELESLVAERTAALDQALTDMRTSQEEAVRRLSRAVEQRDDETADHIVRMSRYCELIARRIGVPPERCELIRIAAPMHDVGKLAVPDAILFKPGPLTDDERAVMRRHAENGWRILSGSAAELLDLAATIALSHHEKWDGTGYPYGIAGDEIPIEGRIAAVADVFDALTSDRVYRRAMPVQRAVEILQQDRGAHFEPRLVDAFLTEFDDVLEILGSARVVRAAA